MTSEKSCGAVVFTRVDGEVRYVLARSLRGHYGFPKGHVEHGETEEETALREIREEVGLHPQLVPGFREISEYTLPLTGIPKQVVIFLAEYRDQRIVPQKEELMSAELVPYRKAMELLPYENDRRILTAADAFLHRK